MRTRHLILLMAFAAAATAQQGDPLTLEEAVHGALNRNPSLESAAARIKAAGERVRQAKAGALPQLKWQESYMAGNNPVYVFGALLTQKQFTEANFNIATLNSPAPLNNFQSLVTAEQVVYDFGSIKHQTQAAQIGQKMSVQDRVRLQQQIVAGVARSYHGVTLAQQAVDVAREAAKSAQADLERAQAMQAAGLATEADVLSVRVFLSGLEEQAIRRQAELDVTRAALNEVMGLSLDTPHTLTTQLRGAAPLPELSGSARPELEQVKLAAQVAEAQQKAAKAGYWPQIGVRGAFEADRQQFVNKGGGNWMFAASARWNLFDGNATRSRAAEAGYQKQAAEATARSLQNGIALEVRQAQAALRSASERITVTDATIAQADESLRILRNRYGAGLANITDVLRASTALLEAKTRRLAAVYDQRIAAVQVELAAGVLNGDSNVLK